MFINSILVTETGFLTVEPSSDQGGRVASHTRRPQKAVQIFARGDVLTHPPGNRRLDW